VSRGRKLLLAFLAALLGLAVGAVSASLIGTVKLSLMPGLEYASLKDFLLGLPLIFLEGLLWSVLGGGMYVLPPGFLLLATYALTFRPKWLEPLNHRSFVIGVANLLYAPLFFFGPRDALLFWAPMLLGVWISLRFLNSRLSRAVDEKAVRR
jgi:hypothetical protein